jgi:hypothetical protein
MASHEPTAMDTFITSSALSSPERDRLAGLLAAMPAPGRWAVGHMYGPLLCALGLVTPPDAAYAQAAQRRFADSAETRRRALTLLEQLERDARNARYEQRRRKGWHGFRRLAGSRSTATPPEGARDAA